MPPPNDQAQGRRSAGHAILIVGASFFAAVGFSVWLWKRETAPEPVDRVAAAQLAAAPLVRPPEVSRDYVGSTVCRDCHREIWERYQSHPMAHSLSRVLESGVREDEVREREFSRGK